jgi:hypothetical protein
MFLSPKFVEKVAAELEEIIRKTFVHRLPQAVCGRLCGKEHKLS